ncbi:alpha/beta fold hydrolase [Phytohabitans suffuscus]|uniref:AB hydrolase-1 domain-containing protein n=1 Tax=Phytohabitans suffuscus TaxID=624315 RepID=A0A6F8Y9R8_9ACTN|nr:alpha/beta hydrolase [Phytohabitans suffuscus]BCB82728.1 hypothetical protein Psuf_000410 [Phytohabitans suffuscus]
MDLSVTVAGGVALHVRHLPGTGAEPPFLLVHGLNASARIWDEVSARLNAAGHATFAVDMRGHGGSDVPERGYDQATAAADLVAVRAGLGLRAPVVVGHSWGASVSVRFAGEHPDLLSALAMVDGGWITPAVVGGSWEEFSARWGPRELDGVPAESIRGSLGILHPDWSPTTVEAAMAALRVLPDGTAVRRLPVACHGALLRDLWDDPPTPWYASVSVPVLLMPAIPDERRIAVVRPCVAAVAAAVPHATVSEYLDSEHDLHAQHPGRVAADLLGLARTARRSVRGTA